MKEHKIIGDESHKAEAYELSVTDVDRERRNFPGYEEKEYYSLEDIRNNEWKYHQGTTDTDDYTDGQEKEMKPGYAGIYKKEGLPKPRSWESSSTPAYVKDNTVRLEGIKKNWRGLAKGTSNTYKHREEE